MKHRKPFRTTVARTLAPKLLLLAVGASLVGPGYVIPQWTVGTDAEVMALRPDAEGSPAALIAEHDCWTGSDHPDVIPGHVVVTVDGVTRLAGARVTDRALEQVIDGIDHGLIVHGFCE